MLHIDSGNTAFMILCSSLPMPMTTSMLSLKNETVMVSAVRSTE